MAAAAVHHLIRKLGNSRGNPLHAEVALRIYRPLAQLVEHSSDTRKVIGAHPIRSTQIRFGHDLVNILSADKILTFQ